jgi:two-component system cell cycle response regulator
MERSGEQVSVALIDLDHFKRINDSWGHHAGDRVLRGFSERLVGELRAVDVSGRYGGEEFLVVFMNAGVSRAMEATERCRAAMAREPFVLTASGETLSVTLSAGVAEARLGDDVEDLLARADAALYEAKSSGRNQVLPWRRKAA